MRRPALALILTAAALLASVMAPAPARADVVSFSISATADAPFFRPLEGLIDMQRVGESLALGGAERAEKAYFSSVMAANDREFTARIATASAGDGTGLRHALRARRFLRIARESLPGDFDEALKSAGMQSRVIVFGQYPREIADKMYSRQAIVTDKGGHHATYDISYSMMAPLFICDKTSTIELAAKYFIQVFPDGSRRIIEPPDCGN